MKYLLPLLTLSLLFSQELEVEGDLKVTGTVESTTIDSLQQIIANMQAQIDSMHSLGGLETRVFEISDITISELEPYEFNLNTITGFDLDNAFVQIIDFDVTFYEGTTNYIKVLRYFPNPDLMFSLLFNGTEEEYINGGGVFPINNRMDCFLSSSGSNAVIFDMTFYITAQFPD